MKYIISSLFFITIIFAQWSTNPASPQSLGSGVQVQLAATSDGGVYVAWLSDGNNYHVFLQRLNSMGEPQWSDNGMVVSNNANASWIAVYHLNLAVDSEDNAIITTMDQRAGGAWEVYAYKIASDGTMLWGDDGVSLTSSSVSNMSPRLTVLPDNSVVVTWTHNDDTVLFQCISSDGTLLWDTGILIEDNDATLISPKPIVTSDGNVLIQWIRQTGLFWASNSELYLQKYDHEGTADWSNPIVAAGPVVFPMGNWLQQSIADDISGSFSAWTEMSGNVQNARAQHINDEGVLSWAGGVDLSTNSSNFRMSPQLTFAENSQELMAVWKESNGSQNQRGVSAQRLDSNGDRLWGSSGASVVELNSNYDYLDLNIAGFGDDLIATYIEQSGNMNGNIYAVRLDVNGDNVWTGGTVVVTNSNTSKSDMMITNGPGCVFIAWTEGGSIYAHCLLEDGMLGVPIPPLFVPSEYPTIQAAIDSASDGETVLVAAGTYVENINFNGKNIAVIGADSSNTIINGNQSGVVVTFMGNEDSTAMLSGFTISGGFSTDVGGIICIASSPTLTNLMISDNSTTLDGGGVYLWGSNTTLMNVTISGNSASNNGGGIFCGGNSNPTITNVIVSGNTATNGGGIYCENSNITITDVTINGNSAGNSGGGLFINDSTFTVNNAIISSNTASNDGGGIRCQNSSELNISFSAITNNSCDSGGGGIAFSESTSNLVNVSIINNNDSFDAGLFLGEGSSVVLNNSLNYGNDIYFYGDGNTIQISYSNIQGGYEGEGNIDADPFFCNPDSGDYTLAENSPCVGTGENGANMGSFGVGCGPIYVGPMWHVSTTGSDSTGDGSEDNPFATIQTALNNANVSYYENIGNLSDTIMVHDGTYIINALGDEVLSHDIYSNGSYTAIIISENGPTITILEGSNEYSHIGMTEVGYTLHGFTLDGFQYFGSGDNIEFNNCLLIRTISFSATSCPEPCFTFNNSTFTENNVDQIDETSLFLNSIIYNNTNLSLNDTDTIRYCIHDLDFDGVGSINTDPLFCNPDSGDFTLAENSPAVGAGENGANIGAFGVGCNIQVDWDFSLSEPVIEVMGADNVWNPGDTISVEMDFCNNTDVAHNWYPGVTIESDSSLTSLHSGHIWFYAMVADECHTISWGAIANTSIISDTVVTFSAYPEALNCQSQPEYCIDGDTLTFEVPIIVQVVSAAPEPFAPEQFSLHQNYPNPFNPVTTLRYDLPENNLVNITIYDMMGRKVKTLINQTQDAGYKSVIWNATNNYGKPVSAGIYLYQIQAGEYISTKKMVLLK